MATRKIPDLARGRQFSIAQQWASVRFAVPSSVRRAMNGSNLRCEVRLRPTALSCEYLVTVGYTLGTRPEVRLASPELRTRNGEEAPHVFGDGSLCLFRFPYREWSARAPIGRTILPWTSLWLYFYETWLVTGVWHGGGEHPTGGPKDQARDT